MKYVKKLVGERIYLSPANPEDFETYSSWLNDFHTTDYIGRSSAILSLGEEKDYLLKAKDYECFLSIIELESDKLLGNISLGNIEHISRTATLGIFIGDIESRNKGYGTEAIKLLLDYGFNYLNLNNIDLKVFSFNERAIRCYEKCGFKVYGKRTEAKFINGKYYDEIFMEVLAKDFKGSAITNKNV
ncbi:MAG: GNAT family N-acetyltransferase [Clostridia bacterium]|nr:GNAT family N-acetyltransferase [Clostridia bacterium]